MGELTVLADFALEAAYRFCRADLERQHGRLLVPGTSRDNRFVILGMGKLGGKELNFSSDIDLIYLYETDEPANRRAIPPRGFFNQLAERLTDAMGKITEDGLVFRTDLRLRPMGSHGPSAQPVAGDVDLGEAFLGDVRPFVYRRYLDFSTVEELRDMKARIERQQLPGGDARERNVKLGYGGILVEGYTFLRRLGHRLRLERDHDPHVLEREPGRLRAVARALGYEERGRKPPGATLLRDYEKRRERIRACYERFFSEAE